MKKIQINNFKENLYFDELDNGLKVFVIPMKNKKNFSSMIVTRYGARDICFSKNNNICNTPTGIAHFLEHKMFDRSDDPFKFYGKFGTDVNASTSDDYTCYYFIGSKCFNKSLKFLLNWIQSLEITDESVEKERGIILEEASMYKDNPGRVMYNKVKENIFVNDPKKNKVIGTDSDIKRITKEDLNLCYRNFYCPNNMYLLVAGNVNPKEVFEIAKSETKSFNKNINIGLPIYIDEPNSVFKSYDEVYMNIGIPRICLAYKINKICFKSLNVSAFELDLYLHFLINISLGMTSEIRQKWVEMDLFTDTFYRISEIESHYVIEFYANTNKCDELVYEFEKYINNLNINIEAFEREKKIWISNEIRAIESPITTIYNVLDDLLDYGEFISDKVTYIRNLDFDILLKLKECIDFNSKSIIKILPLQFKDKID